MLDYQDFEKTKRELLEAQAEYLKKRDNLREEREKIVWNIEIFEKMVGDTNLFNDIKNDKPQERDNKIKPYIQTKREKITSLIITIVIAIIYMILFYLNILLKFL